MIAWDGAVGKELGKGYLLGGRHTDVLDIIRWRGKVVLLQTSSQWEKR